MEALPVEAGVRESLRTQDQAPWAGLGEKADGQGLGGLPERLQAHPLRALPVPA